MISLASASASTSASTSAADLRPLDEDDFRRFDALLDATGNEDAMVVEEIDGFLAALACVPDPIGENELLAQVLGTESFGDDSSGGGASGSEPREAHVGIATLLRRHAAQVVAALDAAEFAPVLSHDEDGNADGVAWAVGFLRGVELHPDSWETLLAEKDFDDVLDAMESLTAELDEDAGGDEDAPSAPGSQAERDGLIDRMIGDIADIHEFFRPWREAGTTPAAMRVETVRRAGPKTGRNEPCPCGSGRKYKSCCGAG